ncbi:hypothetical protein N7474_005963 [Penicillium riverlandense]|uniref:uncharacterized protein n=1 Tax=Penicillium riverlandense TaxID=1903569 RepID=UPI00254668CF|nr:uncharacterized protein N7474_005963 [Penicillium riverlandense]KAJ5820372.1 hypothetical protein N7474_005963 [Penicillium riverlandense]
MAHQAHNIPWTLLASNLKWHKGGLRTGRSQSSPYDVTNLRPRGKPNQGKEIAYFVEAFARTIDEHAACERKKYPETYDPPSPEDIILDDRIVGKITPTVRRLRSYKCDSRCPSDVCWLKHHGHECRCIPISDDARKMSAFLQPYRSNYCYQFFDVNRKAFFQLQLVETLILYGEMDAVLRICAHPEIGLERWWLLCECYCSAPSYDLGWDQLFKNALYAYICLNIVYCFPEMWDPASGKTDEKDYRDTRLYQRMLRECTASWKCSDVITYPHRQFFGIADRQFPGAKPLRSNTAHWLHWAGRTKKSDRFIEPYGRVPIEEFLSLDNSTGYQPAVSDMDSVRWILCRKGLPVELTMDIMELAGYDPKRRLEIPHDPFHPSNREELSRYLTYCWQIIVRCDMMGKALGMEIRWQEFVASVLIDFFDYKHIPRDANLRKAWGCWDRDEPLNLPYVFA